MEKRTINNEALSHVICDLAAENKTLDDFVIYCSAHYHDFEKGKRTVEEYWKARYDVVTERQASELRQATKRGNKIAIRDAAMRLEKMKLAKKHRKQNSSAEKTQSVNGITNNAATIVDANAPLVLNQDRIQKAIQDTHRVRKILREAMDFEDVEATTSIISAGPSTASTKTVPEDSPGIQQLTPPNWSSLEPRYHGFLRVLISQPVWHRSILDNRAREHRLMLGGALEVINEWSLEIQGDWLTSEEGDQIRVLPLLV